MKKKLIFLTIFTLLFTLTPISIKAVECGQDLPRDSEQLREYANSCEHEIGQLQEEQKTLQAAINLLNSKINLTQAQIRSTNNQISQLEKDIQSLSIVIEDLNKELNNLSQVFHSRVKAAYKSRSPNPLFMLFFNQTFNSFQNRLHYLQLAQRRDQLIIHELDSARTDYDQQKTTKEEKQAEIEALQARLESQQATLNQQQNQKELLLRETKNSETIFQSRLTKAVEELKAIESIIAGQGSEVEFGKVEEGYKIATVIPSASACSTGGHLHFEVVKDQNHHNPASFLKSIGVTWDNDPDPAFSLTGSWDWPLHEPIRVTQGYGHTAYSSRYANNQHTGLDIVNTDNYEVKAVSKGTLYRGSILCGGGTLKYVHLSHQDNQYDTYYLHVNYF